MTQEQFVEAVRHINECRRKKFCFTCINYNIEINKSLNQRHEGGDPS